MNYTVLIYFKEQHCEARLIANVVINSYCFTRDVLSEAAQSQIFFNLADVFKDRVSSKDRFELLYLKNGEPFQRESWHAEPRVSAFDAETLKAEQYLSLSEPTILMVRDQIAPDTSAPLTYICEALMRKDATNTP